MKARYAALLILAGFLVSSHVLADSLPMEYGYCQGKKIGDSCISDEHVRGECKETSWSGAGRACVPGEVCPPHPSEMILVCESKPQAIDKGVPVEPLIFGFGVSAVMVGTGLFIVLHRRKRLGS